MSRDGWREKGHSLLEVLASGNRRQAGIGGSANAYPHADLACGESILGEGDAELIRRRSRALLEVLLANQCRKMAPRPGLEPGTQ